MKLTTSLALSGILFTAGWTSQASLIVANWTFEAPPSDVNNSTTISGIAADSGIKGGYASGLHASPFTDWKTPVGNGSPNSLSANNWAVGDYFQFQTSLLGYRSVTLSWEQTRSLTGPASFKLAYSTDGMLFTEILGDSVDSTSWSSTSYASGFFHNHDLSSFTALDNRVDVYFRLVAASAPTHADGTSRVDDFTISATPIPEPSTLLAGALLVVPFGLCGIRYLRNRNQA